MKNYYDILGVSPHAVPEVIKAAYRAMSQKFHPDITGGGSAANAMMAEINRAYETLGSSEKRALYDQQLDLNGSGFTAAEPDDDEEEDDPTDYGSSGTVPSNFPDIEVPKKLPIFRAFEYTMIVVFAILTALLLMSPSRETLASSGGPAESKSMPAVPIPSAPAPAQRSKPSPSSNDAPLAKILTAPNGIPWPTTSGNLSGYTPRDFGGSVIKLTNHKPATAFYVKLVSSDHGARAPSRYVYMAPHQQFSIVNVAPGHYWLQFQDLASHVYFRSPQFTLSEGVSRTDPKQLQFTTVAFEFAGSGRGYLDSQQISAAEFGGE